MSAVKLLLNIGVGKLRDLLHTDVYGQILEGTHCRPNCESKVGNSYGNGQVNELETKEEWKENPKKCLAKRAANAKKIILPNTFPPLIMN